MIIFPTWPKVTEYMYSSSIQWLFLPSSSSDVVADGESSTEFYDFLQVNTESDGAKCHSSVEEQEEEEEAEEEWRRAGVPFIDFL